MDKKLYIYNKEKMSFSFVVKVVILLAIVALAGVLIFKYANQNKEKNKGFIAQQDNYPQRFSKITIDDTKLENIATQVFYSYINSFSDKNAIYEYVETSLVTSCEIKGGNIYEFVSKINYKLKPGNVDSQGYCNWGKVDSNGYVISNVDIRIKRDGLNSYYMTAIAKNIDITDLEKYTPTQSYKEENETIAKTKQHDYKIQGNNLKVTYNGGSTWTNVELNFADLNTIKSNKLQSTCWYITPAKTMFVYGGNDNTYIKVTISNDKGKTWNTYNVAKGDNISSYFVGFYDDNNGYIIASSKDTIIIYQTSDGGVTWNSIQTNGLKDKGAILGGSFATQDIGYITFKSVQDYPVIYRTINKSRTWERVELKFPDDMQDKEKYIFAHSPTYEGKITKMLVTQTSDDIQAGTKAAQFISSDYGITWVFDKIINYIE